MIDEAKLNKDQQRGARAEALLGDELVQEAFKQLETQYLQAWASTTHDETNAREHYWKAVQILGDVQKHLKKVAQDGRLAKKALSDLALKFRPRAA